MLAANCAGVSPVTTWPVASSRLPIEGSADDIPKLLSAVAQFEKQNAFIHVLDLSITPDPENPSKRIAGINVTTLVAK